MRRSLFSVLSVRVLSAQLQSSCHAFSMCGLGRQLAAEFALCGSREPKSDAEGWAVRDGLRDHQPNKKFWRRARLRRSLGAAGCAFGCRGEDELTARGAHVATARAPHREHCRAVRE